MSNEVRGLGLENYVLDCESLASFKRKTVVALAAAAAASAVIGALSYLALSHGWLPFHFSTSSNIVMAASAGSMVAAIAIASIALFYAYKIGDKKMRADRDKFLEALKDETTTAFIQGRREGKYSDLEHHLRQILDNYSDAQWKDMLFEFDQELFFTTTDEKILERVYNTLFEMNPFRFIKNYCELKVASRLSDASQTYLDENIEKYFEHLLRGDLEEWQNIMYEIDNTYFGTESSLPDQIKESLIHKIYEHDKEQFLEAYLRSRARFSINFQYLIDYSLATKTIGLDDKASMRLMKVYYREKSHLHESVIAALEPKMEETLLDENTSWFFLITETNPKQIEGQANTEPSSKGLIEAMCTKDIARFSKEFGDDKHHGAKDRVTDSMRSWIESKIEKQKKIEAAPNPTGG